MTVAMPITVSALLNAFVLSTLIAALPVSPPLSPDPERKLSVWSLTSGTAAFGP